MLQASDKIRWLVRLGYLSRAVLYGMIGVLALNSSDQVRDGAKGVFRAIEDFPAGTALLWIVTIGMVGYALFRFASPLFDIEHEGSDKKGIAIRIGHAGSAIGHLVLAYTAFQLATGSGSGGNAAQEAAAGVLSFQLGSFVLGLLGAAFLLTAIFQAKKGVSGEFMNRVSSAAPSATRWIGGLGYAARAVVFAVIGWSLIQSAWFSTSSEVVSLGGAIASLSDDGIWFDLVAVGLVLFGIFSLFLARYRIVPDLGPDGRVPSFRL
ncbi:hypothetical protein FHS61_002110 [Altererythrobacter atlanticus]|uniref:Uncharacterized protein n=1 Tax=Croceibacterium atlanticum TaxID=1267766 RepID=A0A0F7KR09_9SPHN|nr:DUF1206 domain-containing protein [Croceibacterium atlanticum]AKH41622.1 hypothetical protein WYH_00564 [Croceibacterium atlanticum]MBB5733084.1 hypothetical protein [Croceibacterium atlanticum]